MEHLRESLLSSSPRGIPYQSSNILRDQEDTRASVARGDLAEVRGAAFYNRTWIVSSRYCRIGDGVDSLEEYIHSLWYMYYQLSRHTSHETTDHDRLVLDIVRIQGTGPLTRPVSGVYGIDIARTAEGVLWNDLPFLATDMTEWWMNDCGPMSSAHRLNFNSFLAKLASTRASKDRVCQIALVLFRYMFEMDRELHIPDESDDEYPNRSIHNLDMVRLLPAAFAWIKEAGENIMLLSSVSWNDCPGTIGQCGERFMQSELGQLAPVGFSPWRWMFWLKRLHEIQDEAKETNEAGLEKYATDAINLMVKYVEDRNSEILRAYQNGGEVLHQDKHLACLKDLVKLGGTVEDDVN
ncbi:hypothetical protein ASPWEDRAFT_156031 [Aspergillus wentii DTO 134E9]|uniref:Uncharacterized protein n=1 Tax=Aspergillus wentii DTO 134E9 TaxID=1073089 RepID=A0A1L9RLL7_ASPWE|nr:uncharacterized protein ASPWEDRAFT_156031 [Aspergillus wentii DTO 134E9]KAI9929731.1 hypothetical protein MW887_001207 [Aspergillus wentii]OJJ35811.1 hypothetical protein ASPWEDRAFT_156031 [Aspergillus wentii DTO 134E9]